MGVVYDLNGETEKAIAEFEKSVGVENNYAAHLRLGANYARLGDLPRALKELDLVLAADPKNVQARYLRALIYSTQKDFDKAADEYEAILQSFSSADPANIEIYGYLGQLYYSQRQYPKAIKQFETILSLDPKNTDVLFLLGTLYLEVNDRTKAIELLRRAVKINPDYDVCLNSLAYIYAEDGMNLDEAEQFAERAIAIDPDNGAYLDSLGWVYFKKGEYDKALKYLLQADSILKDPVIYEHLGDVYHRMKREDDAKKYWQQSLQLLPSQPQVVEKLRALAPQQ